MKLQELWPEAKGTDRTQITRFLCKSPDLDFCTKIDVRLPAEGARGATADFTSYVGRIIRGSPCARARSDGAHQAGMARGFGRAGERSSSLGQSEKIIF